MPDHVARDGRRCRSPAEPHDQDRITCRIRIGAGAASGGRARSAGDRIWRRPRRRRRSYVEALQPRLPFSVATARLALVYGPPSPPSISCPGSSRGALPASIRSCGGRLDRRDLVFVDDVVAALLLHDQAAPAGRCRDQHSERRRPDDARAGRAGDRARPAPNPDLVEYARWKPALRSGRSSSFARVGAASPWMAGPDCARAKAWSGP